MSVHEVGPQPVEVDGEMVLYGDGMTVQSFKDDADINQLLSRAARGESLSHLVKHGAEYVDFADAEDLMQAVDRIERGREIFAELPSEIRNEFNNDMAAFFTYVNDPENRDKLRERLPKLAEPGRVLPAVLRTQETQLDPRFATAIETAVTAAVTAATESPGDAEDSEPST